MSFRLIASSYLILSISIVAYQVSEAAFVATTNECPGKGFQWINNGCYYFSSVAMNWSSATEDCSDRSPNSTTHLVSIESETEAIALYLWMIGQSNNRSYWLDGEVKVVEKGNKYRGESLQTRWKWSSQIAQLFSYLKYSDYRTERGRATLLYWNTSYSYEYRSANKSDINYYICERSVRCDVTQDLCRNNGTCYVNSGRVLCVCEPGYWGYLCEMRISMCNRLTPCKNGGTCVDTVNNYTCNCGKHFEGTNCTIDKFRNQRTTESVAISNLVLITITILALCLMDLPW